MKEKVVQESKRQLLVMKKVERAVLLQSYNNQWRRDSKGRAKEEEERGQ